jgi:PAS domain S-box-containing protein
MDKKFNVPVISCLEFVNFFKAPYIKDSHNLEKYAKAKNWDVPFDVVQKAKTNNTAIIVTDTIQNILWSSCYFENLTGYEHKEVIGKNPKMLQGEETCHKTRLVIRKSLEELSPYIGKVVNYRKEGLLYECDIQIHPIFDKNKKLVNFIAFEREG